MCLLRTESPVERWGVYEVRLPGPQDGNPFVDVSFGARFRHRHRVVSVNGFYDGNGDYCVRYSPDAIGEWTYVTCSNRPESDASRAASVQASTMRSAPIARASRAMMSTASSAWSTASGSLTGSPSGSSPRPMVALDRAIATLEAPSVRATKSRALPAPTTIEATTRGGGLAEASTGGRR